MTTQTLTEEIFDIIYEGRRDFADKWKKTDLEITEEIISRIEKRIDSMYVKHPNTAGIGYNECLDDIKKEVLK